ncbi:MAG: trypsin-like peptidase domain-containing protein [Longimicrobiales bacterium]
MKSKAKLILYTTLAFVLGLGMASGLGWTGPTHAMPTLDDAPRVSQEALGSAQDLSNAFVEVADAVTPAVVSIRTERREARGQGRLEIPEEFRRFFGPEGDGQGQPRPQFSGGSGFIVSSDGYILTNNHVVSGAEGISVTTRDRMEYTAEIVGTDPTTDLAVIKIDGSDLPTASFGSSAAVRVGEWVVAVGNPGFGGAGQLDYTVTAGIVSAKGRPIQIIRRSLMQDPDFEGDPGFGVDNFIQTDAVINPGNSGGPLVNIEGQVVGVNSAIMSQTGFYQGYGFAIPVDLTRRVMEDLIEYGRVRRAWLGVQIEEVDPVDAEAYNLPTVSGVLVQGVEGDSPADDAGLQVEDVVVEVDGTEVATPSGLQSEIAQLRPGATAELTVYRDGERRTLDVELGEAPFTLAETDEPATAPSAVERLGISVQPLNAEAARELGYDEPGGVVISGVLPGGAAWERGVPTGWRLLEINDQPVDSPDDVREILGDTPGGSIVKLDVQGPDGTTRVVNVRMPNE